MYHLGRVFLIGMFAGTGAKFSHELSASYNALSYFGCPLYAKNAFGYSILCWFTREASTDIFWGY